MEYDDDEEQAQTWSTEDEAKYVDDLLTIEA